MGPPRNDVPKTKSKKPSSSRSTQNVPRSSSRAINRAVSNILPSSSNQQFDQATGSTPASGLSPSSIHTRQTALEPALPDVHLHAPQLTSSGPYASGQTTGNLPTHHIYGPATESMPASDLSLSSILNRQTAWEPTSPDVHLHAPQLTLSAPYASGQATGNMPTRRIYGRASGIDLSFIYNRQTAWEPTSPDVHLHAPQLTLGAPYYASGQPSGNLPTRPIYGQASGFDHSFVFNRQTAWEPPSPDVQLHVPQLTLGAPYDASGQSSENLPTCRIYGSATGSTPTSGPSSIHTRQTAWGPTSPDIHLHVPQLTLGAPNAFGQAAGNLSTRHICGSTTGSTPASGCSSIHTRQTTWEPTSPDVRLNAPQLALGIPNPSGTTSSHVIHNHQSRAPQIPRKYSNNSEFSTGASTSADPPLRDPRATTNYSHMDRIGTSTRSARNLVGPSPVAGNSKTTIGTTSAIASAAGHKLPTLLVPSSVPKVSRIGPIPPTLLVPRSVLEVTTIGCDPIPLGENCQLCAVDLAFPPCNSGSSTSGNPPGCAILPCGHALHSSCLEQFYGSTLEIKCPSCASDPVKDSK